MNEDTSDDSIFVDPRASSVSSMPTEEEIALVVVDLLRQRGKGKTICPSEAARRLQPSDWRPLMKPVRAVAKQLINDGQLIATQKGEPVEIDTAKGPLRLRLV